MILFSFLTSYNSVASLVISTVSAQLASNPNYRVVTSGHSLGGALVSVAAISLKKNFPNTNVFMYTYGAHTTILSLTTSQRCAHDGLYQASLVQEMWIMPTGLTTILVMGKASEVGCECDVFSISYANVVKSGVHTTDGVPNAIPQFPLGYRHHLTEYWQFTDPGKISLLRSHS